MMIIVAPLFLMVTIYARNPEMTKPLAPSFVKVSFYVFGLYVVLQYILLVFDHLRISKDFAFSGFRNT
jgi:hypothetical protein